MRSVSALRVVSVAAAIAMVAARGAAQSPTLEDLLDRIGARIADYYARAQNIVCNEKKTVQDISHDYSLVGFGRVTEAELRVESDETGGALLVRQLLKINGRVPRDRDKKAREGCGDPNPLSPEPLGFLLPANRAEYTFKLVGPGRGRDRNALIIEYTSGGSRGNGKLEEDPNGHEECFSWSLPTTLKGRLWIDAATHDVLRVEEHLAGPGTIVTSAAMQRKHDLPTVIVIERHDTTIRYKRVVFRDPEESMMLPESIDSVIMARGLQSVRRRDEYSGYRRFLTGGRIVK